MDTLSFRLTGVSPLLMNSDRFANPLDPLTKAHKELTSKRKKTDEDHELIARSEWRGSLYWDEDLGVVVPGHAVEAMIRDGAKHQKLGKAVKSAVTVIENNIPLQYDGPKDWRVLQNDMRFIDCRGVRLNGRAKLMRTRPRFDKWALEFTLVYDSEQMNEREIVKALDDAGRFCGILDYRPRYGRFEATKL